MYAWKSSAQTQQGYRREKSVTKLLTSDCSVEDGLVGYWAAMECSNVHVPRPSVSTSAGQSEVVVEFAVVDAAAAVAAAVNATGLAEALVVAERA